MSDTASGAPPLLVLGKIAAILDVFSLEQPEKSLAEIRTATALPVSTAQRLVANLVEAGFLDRRGDRFRVGVRLAYWAAPAAQGVELLEVVQPVLRHLRDETGETAVFFRANRGFRICVGVAETRHGLRRAIEIGDVTPVHVGSSGRVLLAYDDELAARVLATDLERLTPTTITDPVVLRAALDRARADGYAITAGERESAASGISAPVFDAQGRISGAVSVMGPTLRMPPATVEGWIDTVVAAADHLTRMLGGRRPPVT